ncbi:hypothetical protein D3C86_938040 [compost metagenome]
MHEALVEHAENDVHRHQRRQNQPRLAGQRTLERLRRALEVTADGRRHADIGLGLIEHDHRIAQRHAGREVERKVGGREHAIVGDGQRADGWCVEFCQRRQRHHLAAQGRAQVEIVETFGLAALLGVQFQNHVVLVDLGLEFVDLALAECVVQRFVDIAGGQTKTRRSAAVDADVSDAAAQLQVIGNIAERRISPQFFRQALGPGAQGRAIVALEHVLILGAARAGAEVDVLPCTQVQDDARHFHQLRANPVDELAGRDIAVTAFFQGDPEPSVGDGLVTARDPDRVRERFDGRIGGDDFGHRQVFFHHVAVGNIGGGFGGAEDETGVLNREETLGNENVASDGQSQRHSEHTDHGFLVGEGAAQAFFVPRQQAFTEALFVVGMVHRRTHEQRGQGWRQGQRDHHRNHDGRGGGQGKFLEQPPDHAAHEQQRNERRHQREADRHHGKTDFPGAFDRRLAHAVAGLQMAVNVFHHHDRIVDHKPHGHHDRHQRQVVQAEAHHIHQGKTGDQRHAEYRRYDQRGRQLTQEQRHHRHHQHDGNQQGNFHFMQGRADGLGAVDQHLDLHRGRQHRFQPRQCRLNAIHGLDDVGAGLAEDHQVHAWL